MAPSGPHIRESHENLSFVDMSKMSQNPMSAKHGVTPTTFNQSVCGLALHTGPTTNLPHSAPSQPDRGK
ncbi:Uncharacterized protein DAT39_014393 [Clarias magur]|uniref:Uncharacterized protein n=1 Tax=Clarias magur TaxID=1594786 RepID=A0A8J4UEH4_CLAMG|nr:Uncharacterized protein DAT39_014393 [Clarias magur]